MALKEQCGYLQAGSLWGLQLQARNPTKNRVPPRSAAMLAAITRSNWGSPMSVFTVQILLPMPLAAQKAPTSHCELRRLLNQRHGTIPKLHSQPEQLMPVLTFTARLLKARHCWGVCSLHADSMYTCRAATPSIPCCTSATTGVHVLLHVLLQSQSASQAAVQLGKQAAHSTVPPLKDSRVTCLLHPTQSHNTTQRNFP